MDESYPIDIHYNKLLDWLIDRRHCDSKWHVQSKDVRNRVALALKNLPDADPSLKEIMKDGAEFVTYFDCKAVLETVKKLDGDSKTLFGQYTAPRVKEWAEIVRDYEKGNLYMAECGQLLGRMVKYELPALKQQISRAQQIMRDCLRREEELNATAASLKDKYRASCEDMGIKGSNVTVELSQLVKELPEVFSKVLECLPSLLPSITIYQSFVQTVTGRQINEDQFLPMLSYILKNGNVTVYQWKHGTAPILEQNTDRQDQNGTEDIGDGIDWGTGNGTASGQDGGIDFGGIDFGDLELVDSGDGSGIVLSGEGEGLEGIVTVEEGGVSISTEGVAPSVSNEESVSNSTEGVAPSTSNEEGMSNSTEGVAPSASNEEGMSISTEGVAPKEDYTEADLQLILENSSTRNLFLDDIFELKEFLSRRLQELDQSNAQVLNVYEDFNMESSSESISEMLGHVITVLDHMTNQRVQHLFLIKGSQSYLQRLSERLQENLRLSNRASSQALENAGRREVAKNSLTTLQPQHSALVKRTKSLQTQMAEEVSHRYNNRTVNIMGEINQI